MTKGENNMRTKSAFASILVLVAGLGTALAQQPPMENKGMKVEPLSGYALGKQGLDDFAQRQFRIRQITIEPGGVAGFHSHKERPAMTYIMKGRQNTARAAPTESISPARCSSKPPMSTIGPRTPRRSRSSL